VVFPPGTSWMDPPAPLRWLPTVAPTIIATSTATLIAKPNPSCFLERVILLSDVEEE